MSPRLSCRRTLLNQPMYSTIASSSCERLRQMRSAISSVLKLSTNDSASALSVCIPDPADGDEHGVVVEGLALVDAGVLGGFSRSSQRLVKEGCDGSGSASCGGSCGAASDAVAGST